MIWSLYILHAFSFFCSLHSTCCTSSVYLFDLQADEARKYGARVYCVGIKDFDEQQVRELYFTECVLKKNRFYNKEALCWKGVKKGKHM